MMDISLHNFNREAISKEAERTIDVSFEAHRKFKNAKPRRLEMFSKSCAKLVGYYTHLEPNPSKAKEYFHLEQKSLMWYFKLSMQAPGTITKVHLDDNWSFNIESTGSNSGYTDCISWKGALTKAIIARDNDGIRSLMDFPEEIMERAPIKAEKYQTVYTHFLKSYFRNQPNMGELLLNSYKLADPDLVAKSYVDTMLNLSIPEMDLWASFLSDGSTEFNERLADALILFREKHAKNHPKSPLSLINYSCTALAALAYDKGWEITVESPYIPMDGGREVLKSNI